MPGTDYSTYLKIPELLTLQVPLTNGADDELLFIVVHQSYELWFKVCIDEMRKARDHLREARPTAAARTLTRLTVVEDLLLSHLRVLNQMSPEKFLEFRDPLDPASGFQSYQFRALEFLSGVGRATLLESGLFSDEIVTWLRSVKDEGSVWDAFVHALRHEVGASGLGRTTIDLLLNLYRDHASEPRGALHAVAERLLDHDQRLAEWRHQHYLMAARQIGQRPGTGGSAGMNYLASTLGVRMYPLLWDVRSAL
ncbi:MAG: tryptophan 2,3-dioxygenase [Acidimicrobiaceae bacterium]|nr:tryptophan 2,3-dioxygenase [Acidimicrobiaceae bacterium]